jgi:DNA-binding NarL/FixJ family response regulator
MLRILLADEHPIVRRAVRKVLEAQRGWEICAETEDGSRILELARETRPDVAVVGIALPGLSGVQVTQQLRQWLPSVKVLIFTFHDEEGTILAALAAGAKGYLLKTEDSSRLVEAVADVAAHRPYFSPVVSDVLLDATVSARGRPRLESFSGRELEIIGLIANGETTPRIAQRLGVSRKTVVTHRAGALRKAGVHSAANLVRFAIKHDLVAGQRKRGPARLEPEVRPRPV